MKRTAYLLVGIALLAGCGGPAVTGTAANPQFRTATASRALGAAVDQDIATLRRATAPFHQLGTAMAAGWSAQITGCLTDPAGAGGMGFHYGNPALIDGSVQVDQPELLLYEPEKNGQMRLVAVEYIVPVSAWTASAPPRLFGRDFHVNAAFQVWALHVWAWKDNPSGMFADWNPLVTCDNAASVSTPMQQ